MSSRWLVGLLVAVGLIVLTRHHSSPPPAPPEAAVEVPPPAAETVQAPPAPPPQPKAEPILKAPPPKVPSATGSARKAAKPFDPRQHRNADLPEPKSVKELLHKQTPYLMATLPPGPGRAPRPDAEINGYFAGYAIYADNTVRKLRLQRAWGDLKFAIEESAGDVREFARHDHGLRVRLFNNDPYSLILDLSDGRLLYLKFLPDAKVPGYDDPLNALQGWLLSDHTAQPGVARLALIDVHAHNRQKPPGSPDGSEWPKVDALRALTHPLPLEYAPEGTSAQETPGGF